MPLAAGIILVLFAVFIGLGFDASNYHRTSALLTSHLDRICQEVVRQPGIHVKAAVRFKELVEELERNQSEALKGARLKEARIIIPTMSDSCFGFPGDCTAADQPEVDDTYTFLTLGISAGTFCDGNCKFRGTTDDPGTSPWPYPTDFWNNYENAGNTVGCEFDAEIDTIIPNLVDTAGLPNPTDGQLITARSVWRKKIRGTFDGTSGNLLDDAPALSIIIDPTMTTHANDSRFWFHDTYLRPRTNPIETFNPNNGKVYFGGSMARRKPGTLSYPLPLPAPPTAPFEFQIPDEVSPFCKSTSTAEGYNGFGGPCNDGSIRNAPADFSSFDPAAAPYTLSDLEERMIACMNPAVLVRNMLLAGVTEHAARHGNARNMTEIMITAVQNRYYENAAGFRTNDANGNLPAYLNPPIKVVSFGEDLIPANEADRFTMPFVGAFDTGDNATREPPSDAPAILKPKLAYGQMNPFNLNESFPAAGPEIQAYHVMVQNQLRSCYHMYDSAAQGLDRHGVEGVHYLNGGPIALVNDTFEPSTVYAYDSELRNNPYPAMNENWGQDCPWGGAGCTPSSAQRKLTAPELLSMLGTVQSCAYEKDLGGGADCVKPHHSERLSPGFGSLDLRGDIVGALCHLTGYFDHTTIPNNPCINNFPAINSPGLFPLADSSTGGNQDVQFPYGDPGAAGTPPQAYLPTGTHDRSSILIVTHHNLSPAESDAIRVLTAPGGPLDGRPITVIWIPTVSFADDFGDESIIDGAINVFKDAFRVPDAVSPSDSVSNALFVLSPYIAKYNVNHVESPVLPADVPAFILDHPYAVGNESYRFREYWHAMLSNLGAWVPKENVYIAGRNVTYERLYETAIDS